jgi:hypothetical protein
MGQLAADNLLERSALITADASAILTAAGRSTFLASVSLLTRFCADVSVHVPEQAGGFERDVRALTSRISYAGTIRFLGQADVVFEHYSAILNVGPTIRSDLPWTAIACDGWVLQVCSGGGPVVLSFSQFNPAATLAAASLGAAEIFKRLLGVVSQVAPLLQNEVFSFLTYTADTDPGPDIRSPIRLDCVLAGAGAIGNGIRHVLIELPVEGWLAVVDQQDAGEENWGTYIDLEPSGFDMPKANLACAGWGAAVTLFPLKRDVAELLSKLGREIPFPDVTLGALDNIEARHEIQRLWPDLAIDGAIGDVTCQVSRHPWGPDTACLQCLFREPAGEDSAVVASRLTGLTVESARRQDEEVTQEDIDAAVGDRKAWLAARKGRQKCSVIREALAEELTAGGATFSPSAPFVACMSGSMVAAEFIKYRMGISSPLDPRFQFNVLVGPRAGTMLEQGRRKTCFCVERSKAIARARLERGSLDATHSR